MNVQQQTITITQNQPLIGIPFEENGKEVIRYFASETQADQALTKNTITDALHLAGAWEDLSWEAAETALSHIRHDSQPTPPLDTV